MANADGTNQSGFEYTLGSRVYVQKPLVLGQLEQVAKALSDLPLNLFNLDALKQDTQGEALKGTLGKLFVDGVLVQAMACVLIPKGKSVRDRNLKEIEEDIRDECDLVTGMRIITDFFECNAPSNLTSMWKGSMIGNLMTSPIKTPEGSTDGMNSSSNSQTETPSDMTSQDGS